MFNLSGLQFSNRNSGVDVGVWSAAGSALQRPWIKVESSIALGLRTLLLPT